MNTVLKLLKNANYLMVLFLLMTLFAKGQIVFEEGYFIDNAGKRTDCLIKNLDWSLSPKSFKYSIFEGGEILTATIDSVKEFGIEDVSKYQRFTLDVDRTNDINSSFVAYEDPIIKEETLFLRLVVEGDACLYADGMLNTYFYSVNGMEVQQLIYKKYIQKNRVITDNRFVSQLWTNLKSPNINFQDAQNLQYKAKDLIKYFEKYNAYGNAEQTNYQHKQKRESIHLRIKPGIRFMSFSMRNIATNLDVDFENDIKPTFGIEAEFVFPFNKNKWSFIFEPTYQSFQSKDTDSVYSFELNYHSIELPIGIKYSMYLSDKSKLFLATSFVLVDIPINSNLGNMDINTRNNINLGVGYDYKNKYGIEFRYGSNRQLLSSYALYSNDYQTFSMVLAYKLF